MAWTCHAESKADMVQKLAGAGLIQSDAVAEAMLAVDRGFFVPQRAHAYMDAPQSIGWGATISAPHMHAMCLELLVNHLRPGAQALDVGSGSGYLSLAFAHLVSRDGAQGRVVGVEHMPELVQASLSSARQVPWATAMLEQGTLVLCQGDGYSPQAHAGPFDAIHVGAAAPEVPQRLVDALAPGGRMVIPVGPESGPQELVLVDKDMQGGVVTQAAGGVMYVPLTTKQHQLQRARMVQHA